MLSGYSPGKLEGGGGKVQIEQLGLVDKARADSSVHFYPGFRTPLGDRKTKALFPLALTLDSEGLILHTLFSRPLVILADLIWSQLF